MAELYIKVADILRFTGALAAARDYYREGLAIYKRIGTASETIKQVQRNHSRPCSFLALLLKTELEQRMKFADLQCEWGTGASWS